MQEASLAGKTRLILTEMVFEESEIMKYAYLC